jgi:NCS1 family nucleobase:cation symporter-1
MEKIKSTKFAYLVDKLAVESEPGLTNAQLMLDLYCPQLFPSI